MSKVCELFSNAEDFEALLDEASMQADSEWEEDFVQEMERRYEDFGENMFLSESQLLKLQEIAGES